MAHSDPDLGSEFGSPTYWNIDRKKAFDIMLAFGFASDGGPIPNMGILWKGSPNTYSQYVYTNAMSMSLGKWWDRYAYDPYQLAMERKFNSWFPWAIL